MDSLTTLQSLGSGRLLREMAEHLAHVSEEVIRTGNKGGVSVTITVEKWKDTGMVAVAAVVKPNHPSEKATAAMFYPSGGALFHDDPNQLPLAFNVVDTATGEIRSIEDDAPVKEAN